MANLIPAVSENLRVSPEGREIVSYRAAYAAAAITRLSDAVLDAPKGGRREALSKAYTAEQRYLRAHREASDRRERGARTTRAMAEQYGSVLVWRHAANGEPEEPRISHAAADGKSFDTRDGVPSETGALPGVLPGCTCAWVPSQGGEERMR